MSVPTNCLRPKCRKHIPGRRGIAQMKWCSKSCREWSKRHPDIARQQPKLNFLTKTKIDEVRLVTDFVVGCRSSAELARQHNTIPEYIESMLCRMGVPHPDVQRTFDVPDRLLRDLALAA